MRIVLKIAFSFLIWPILLTAQGPPPVQPDPPPAQNPTEPQGASALLDSTPSPSPAPIIPVPAQTHPLLLLEPMNKTPLPAAHAPELKASVGYSVTDLGLPSGGRLALNGANVTLSVDSGNRFGAKLDLSYSTAPNVFRSGRSTHMLSYLVGPVFYPKKGDSLSTYVHFLAGGARVAGPFPLATDGLEAGHVHYPAWAAGGGVECFLSRGFALRVGVDYLHTHFYNPLGAVRGQNDIRVVNSLVYYPGMLSTRKHHR